MRILALTLRSPLDASRTLQLRWPKEGARQILPPLQAALAPALVFSLLYPETADADLALRISGADPGARWGLEGEVANRPFRVRRGLIPESVVLQVAKPGQENWQTLAQGAAEVQSRLAAALRLPEAAHFAVLWMSSSAVNPTRSVTETSAMIPEEDSPFGEPIGAAASDEPSSHSGRPMASADEDPDGAGPRVPGRPADDAPSERGLEVELDAFASALELDGEVVAERGGAATVGTGDDLDATMASGDGAALQEPAWDADPQETFSLSGSFDAAGSLSTLSGGFAVVDTQRRSADELTIAYRSARVIELHDDLRDRLQARREEVSRELETLLDPSGKLTTLQRALAPMARIRDLVPLEERLLEEGSTRIATLRQRVESLGEQPEGLLPTSPVLLRSALFVAPAIAALLITLTGLFVARSAILFNLLVVPIAAFGAFRHIGAVEEAEGASRRLAQRDERHAKAREELDGLSTRYAALCSELGVDNIEEWREANERRRALLRDIAEIEAAAEAQRNAPEAVALREKVERLDAALEEANAARELLSDPGDAAWSLEAELEKAGLLPPFALLCGPWSLGRPADACERACEVLRELSLLTDPEWRAAATAEAHALASPAGRCRLGEDGMPEGIGQGGWGDLTPLDARAWLEGMRVSAVRLLRERTEGRMPAFVLSVNAPVPVGETLVRRLGAGEAALQPVVLAAGEA